MTNSKFLIADFIKFLVCFQVLFQIVSQVITQKWSQYFLFNDVVVHWESWYKLTTRKIDSLAYENYNRDDILYVFSHLPSAMKDITLMLKSMQNVVVPSCLSIALVHSREKTVISAKRVAWQMRNVMHDCLIKPGGKNKCSNTRSNKS